MAGKTPEKHTDVQDEVDTEPDSKTAETLSSGFGRESHQRAGYEVHYYTFADGTSAKVWQTEGDSHVSVQFRDRNGRGTTATTQDGLTVNAANKLVEEAGQKAIDIKAVEGS